MAREKEVLDFKEAVTLFLDRTMSDFKNEEEIPAMNVKFPISAFKLFEYIQEHPFEKEGWYVPPIYPEDIKRAKIENQSNPNIPSIIVNNPVRFFEYLTNITNLWIEQKNKYWGGTSTRATFIRDIKRLFLRMSPNDLTNIEEFLELQESFLKATTFDEYIKKNIEIGEFQGYKLFASKEENATWCETNDKMTFYLKGENEDFHTLPSIYFATTEENGKTICYIYAIQNERFRKTDKRIQRKLYKLNANIENPSVNPGSVLVLKTFIEMLREKGITDIRVPKKQVLSYRYHEILSEKTKKDFEKNYSEEQLEYINNLNSYERAKKLEEYEWQKVWYSHVVDKQDFIEYAKTEGLFNIFRRVLEQFSILESQPTESDNLCFSIIEPQVRKLK